ncbi:MAG: hypothetical protein ABI969_20560, partial [bacterium]
GGTTATAGAVLTAEDASAVRRNSRSLVALVRSDLGSTNVGRLDPSRTYAQSDVELWFAISAFADNTSVYEQIVRNGGNHEAAVLGGRSLVAAARRVDTAIQGSHASVRVQDTWTTLRRQLAALDTGS